MCKAIGKCLAMATWIGVLGSAVITGLSKVIPARFHGADVSPWGFPLGGIIFLLVLATLVWMLDTDRSPALIIKPRRILSVFIAWGVWVSLMIYLLIIDYPAHHILSKNRATKKSTFIHLHLNIQTSGGGG